MKRNIIVLLICFSVFSLCAQTNKKEKDIRAIKSMCGCFKVKFNFIETFNYSKDSLYVPSKIKQVEALEYGQLVSETNDKIQIQHLLVIPMGEKKEPMIMKHWRQDWLYENTDLYSYNKGFNWLYVNKTKEEVRGQWTQKVYQVDDSPRYEGSSTWVHVDGKTYWENTSSAPLPRREYSKRRDYDFTLRRNRQEILANGWVHDQYNDKVLRLQGGGNFILAQEKGFNEYIRVDEKQCEAAKKWWVENKRFWKHVRNKWDDIYSENRDLTLRSKVDKKKLYSLLFSMEPSTKKREIKKTINKYIVKD